MANLSGTNVAAAIMPFTTEDTYPTHVDLYGKGGFRVVATTAERDAIPAARRTAGMVVKVTADGKEYELNADLTTWKTWAPSGTAITIDTALSTTSTNAVQNKVITAKINTVESTANTANSTANAAKTTAEAAIPKANIAVGINDGNKTSDALVPSTKAVYNHVSTVDSRLSGEITTVKNTATAAQTTANNAIPKSKIDTTIDGSETDQTTVPSVPSVIAYVKAEDSKVSGTVTAVANRVTTLETWKNGIGNKNAANGVAGLGSDGKISPSQLPAGYNNIDFLENFVTSNPTSGMTAGQMWYNSTTKKIFTATSATAGSESTPDGNDKVYINKATNKSYRWTGSDMTIIGDSAGVALGTTSSTAFRGDYGNTLYTNFGSGTNLTGTQDARNFFSKANTYIPLESQYVIQNLAVNPQSDYVKIQDNVLYLTGEPNSGDGFEIPAANSTKAGVMTAGMYATLIELEKATFPLVLSYIQPNGNTFEVGQSVSLTATLTAKRKGIDVTTSIDDYVITGLAGSISSDNRTYTSANKISSNSSITVSYRLGSITSNKVSINWFFKYKKYWGVSANPSIQGADILSLSSTWADNRTMNATNFDCTGGKYPYYVIPASVYTGLEVWVGGLKNTDLIVTDLTLTNASGASAAYKVVRLANKQTGVLSIQFK